MVHLQQVYSTRSYDNTIISTKQQTAQSMDNKLFTYKKNIIFYLNINMKMFIHIIIK